jgi:hypothetical protein
MFQALVVGQQLGRHMVVREQSISISTTAFTSDSHRYPLYDIEEQQ